MDIYKPLIALLAIVNPIGAVPFYIHFTQTLNRVQRQRTVRVSAFTAFAVIAVSAVAGLRIIDFFGISLASFQVGGGTLLLISSLQMLNAKPAEARTDTVSEGDNKLDAGDSISNSYGITGIPETFVIDSSGLVAFIHIGPVTAPQLQQELDSLLEG